MTEEAKKRMEELAYSYEAPTHRNCYGCCQSDSDYENAFKAGYEAGMQDPDANKELLDECEKVFTGSFLRHKSNCLWHVREFDHDYQCGLVTHIKKIQEITARGK